jgi:hypothetical protein
MCFQPLHRARLVDLSGVRIPKHHLYSGVAKHCSKRNRIDAAFCRSGGPCVTEIVKPEWRNFAIR